jgi:gamma-glutamyl-gamma-aminobutyrate hydrolase PuuD
LDKERFQVDLPVIGIMTMPFWDESMKTESFQYEHFTWEHNVNFVRYAGSFSLPIKYNLPDEELYELLDQINGAYFTGGGLNDLVNTEYY